MPNIPIACLLLLIFLIMFAICALFALAVTAASRRLANNVLSLSVCICAAVVLAGILFALYTAIYSSEFMPFLNFGVRPH